MAPLEETEWFCEKDLTQIHEEGVKICPEHLQRDGKSQGRCPVQRWEDQEWNLRVSATKGYSSINELL